MNADGTISWAALFDEASARLAEVSADPRIDARRIVEQAGGIEPSEFSSMLDELVTTRADGCLRPHARTPPHGRAVAVRGG